MSDHLGLDPRDIRTDTYSSGFYGLMIRMTHLPSGVVVEARTTRKDEPGVMTALVAILKKRVDEAESRRGTL